MRFRWLLLSALSAFLFALPAQAGRLLFWRFESNQNRLIFTTDDRVQPRAQLIANPTRIVLDLPGIVLGRPSVTQPIGGTISSVRVGQFNAQTTRIVIELVPGYTVDPQQVRIRGLTPTQWTVELPTPQRIVQSSPPPALPAEPPSNPTLPQPPSSPPPVTTPPARTTGNPDFQVTRNGLFIRLSVSGNNRPINVKRSRDRASIEFELPGVTLPPSLASETLTVNDYGISTIQFTQVSPSVARIVLAVSKESPDWQGVYSGLGGLVLFPRGGMNAVERSSSPPPSPTPSTSSQSQNATISSVELANNNTQLLIRANQPVRATASWNRNAGVYEIRIPNAQLDDAFRGPQLDRNSPIYQLRIRQETANTVVILVQPALGVQLGQLTQPNSQLLSLSWRSLRASTPPSTSTTIPVPPPPSVETPTSSPSPPVPTVPNGRVLVIIDPGHGGKDPGAIGIGNLYEKDVILPISLTVSQLLQQQGVQVMLTRSSDYFVSLQGRTDLANRAGAKLFVSIHANSLGKGRPDVNGLEVYYYGNRLLAETIHRSIIRNVSIRDRGVRSARFYVLRNARMPSTLVEVGFVTGAQDSANLRTSAYQRQMAEAIARGILDYIQQNRL